VATVDVGRCILLEEQLQGEDVVKLNPGNAPDEPGRHRLVLPDVEVVDVVELGVGGPADLQLAHHRLVVVDLRTIRAMKRTLERQSQKNSKRLTITVRFLD
jgi:hypothetical protein